MASPSPAVSVLLPVYNAEPYLPQALASVLAQTFTDFELLALDDGSTDGSAAILAACRDPRLRIVHHSPNQGLVPTLNHGLELARGQVIARFDADDISAPDRLATQVAFLQAHPEYALIGSQAQIVNAEGHPEGGLFCPTSTTTPTFVDHHQCLGLMLLRNPFCHSSTMYRAAFGLRYDARAKDFEDYALWPQFAKRGRIAILADTLVQYRRHAASITAQADADTHARVNVLRDELRRQLEAEEDYIALFTPLLCRWCQPALRHHLRQHLLASARAGRVTPAQRQAFRAIATTAIASSRCVLEEKALLYSLLGPVGAASVLAHHARRSLTQRP